MRDRLRVISLQKVSKRKAALRLIGVSSIVFVIALTFVMSGFGPAVTAQQLAGQSGDDERRHRNAQAIFRYDTFDDEQLGTAVLPMHEVIATVDRRPHRQWASRSMSRSCRGRSSLRFALARLIHRPRCDH